MTTYNAMTIDVEDWFHILDAKEAPSPSEWDQLPSRLESNMSRMLDLFAEHNVRTTLFWLGWAAQRFPALVKRSHTLGHEIGSHGQNHLLAYQVGRQAFAQDVTESKKILEDLTGAAVQGFRVPGFSFTAQTPWAYDVLATAGYRYSSSIFPAARGHGGFVGAKTDAHTVATPSGNVRELPITTIGVGSKRVCLFGGGYLRMTPAPLLMGLSRALNAQGKGIIYYLHPREIDPDQPRMKNLPRHRYFKYYVNLGGTEQKMHQICRSGAFKPLCEW